MIGIIILNYNTFPDTITLVEDLQNQSIAKKLQIIVVDNASLNDSFLNLVKLQNSYDNVKVIKTRENLGYAKGNNFGLEYLEKEIQPEYVAVLNNDINLPENCFENLINRYKSLEKPAFIAPLQKLPNGSIAKASKRVCSFKEDVLSMFLLYRVLKKNRTKYTNNSIGDIMKVEIIPGSFMFSSFKIFKEIGYFYPNTFLYTEERFIADAVKRKGYNNYILLNESYIHDHSLTINSLHNTYGKYKMVHDGILEYTRKCRKNGMIKAAILKPLMKLSLLEIKLLYYFKNLIVNLK